MTNDNGHIPGAGSAHLFRDELRPLRRAGVEPSRFRITTELPEPTAKLHQVVGGDTAEQLAAKEYGSSVRDGHDLRYYENVLLYVNQQQGRAGITRSYQDPGVLGGGNNNVQLVAGHRIWLVSPAYAKALEAVVPSGSLTGGAVAKVKRFVGPGRSRRGSRSPSRSHRGGGPSTRPIANAVLRMELRSFVQRFILIPTQILHTGRQLVCSRGSPISRSSSACLMHCSTAMASRCDPARDRSATFNLEPPEESGRAIFGVDDGTGINPDA